MKKQNSILTTLPVLFGFFVMGFWPHPELK